MSLAGPFQTWGLRLACGSWLKPEHTSENAGLAHSQMYVLSIRLHMLWLFMRVTLVKRPENHLQESMASASFPRVELCKSRRSPAGVHAGAGHQRSDRQGLRFWVLIDAKSAMNIGTNQGTTSKAASFDAWSYLKSPQQLPSISVHFFSTARLETVFQRTENLTEHHVFED